MSQQVPITISKQPEWQPEHVLIIEVTNRAEYMINLNISFRGADNEVSVRVGIFPSWPTRIPIPLTVADGRTLFLSRTPGRFKATVSGANLTFSELVDIHISTHDEAVKYIVFGKVAVESEIPNSYTMPDDLLVDSLHQWRTRDWAGKAKDLSEVTNSLNEELTQPAPTYPDEWSKYGGWLGKTFESTGFFRTHHDGQRWWLVDPEGCAFWSIGIDCLRVGSAVNVTGIESVFDLEFPTEEEAPHLWMERNGEKIFNAQMHNLERALGPDWKQQWLELTKRRLRRYRVNTIANWSDRELHGYCQVPYVFTMANFPTTTTPIFRDFPDVYADEYVQNSHEFARQLTDIADDPYVIGYFMTNEPQWAFVQGFDIGAQLLMSDEPFASMDVLIGMLRSKYESIASLNSAWHTSFESFDDLKQKQDPREFPASKEDTLAFTAQAVEHYVRVVASACREADPNHLNLGLRWAWIHSDYQLAGGEVLDAFSINCYGLQPDPEEIAKIVAKTGKPMMIGEFHIGSLDKGLPSGGIRNTWTMAESVESYRHYIENAATIPGLLGVHYFQWNDQHVMGRFDGENMQIGLHDVTCRPYAEWVEICRQVHPDLYQIRDGQKEPFSHEHTNVPQGTLVW